MRTTNKVAVYLYRRLDPVAGTDAQWGTLTAIAKLDGCDAVTRSARRVDADLLDSEGFLPYGLSPDDFA